ncbi:MAG: cytochrome c [Boseongicola sp.]|nr:cytochrome c [Boseongicola sp.]NNJ68657.1 cytochrome c [Boseongicola sp.]
MRPILTIALTLGFAATAALAHVGVKDPQVMARMNGMKAMGDDLKTLGQMARGLIPFDEAAANAALVSLKAENDRIPALFAPEATDPKSEALPAIWSDPDGFAQRTTEMAAALNATRTSSPADIAASMRAIGAACSACHEDYRIEK